jgi:hypothetical protein
MYYPVRTRYFDKKFDSEARFAPNWLGGISGIEMRCGEGPASDDGVQQLRYE